MDCTSGKESVFTAYAGDLIRVKAKQLRRRRDFRTVDPDDLQQDLWVAVVRVAGQFDPAKSSSVTYLQHVVDSAVAGLVRARHRQKRTNGVPTHSLSDAVDRGVDSTDTLATTVSEADLTRRTGVEPVDDRDRLEDAEAVKSALFQMPVEMRDDCRRVMGGTVTSAARDLGVSRRQVRNTLAETKPYLERAGYEFR
jgi:RNA polymerase sigma factor (sigma-70 family)